MNNKVITQFAVLSILTIACSPKAREIETIVFDYSSATPLYQYERIESISLIPLQTDENCLIGNEPIMRLLGDNLFIMHGQWSNLERIDRFNSKGQYLNQIGRKGRGPGEIATLVNAWFFYGDNMIGLCRFFSNTILLYDFDGKFVRETQVNAPYPTFEGPTYMVHLEGSNFLALMPAKTDSSRLVILSETGAKPRSMLISDKTLSADFDLPSIFFQTNGRLYYSSMYDNAIYEAKQDTVAISFLIQQGKYAIPHNFYSNPTMAESSSSMQNGVVYINNFLESNDYYAIQLVIKQSTFEGMVWGIKHKREKEWFWSRMETWALYALEYCTAAISEDNRFMVLLQPYALKEKLPLMKNVLNPQIVESLSDDDNLVLVEVRLK